MIVVWEWQIGDFIVVEFVFFGFFLVVYWEILKWVGVVWINNDFFGFEIFDNVFFELFVVFVGIGVCVGVWFILKEGYFYCDLVVVGCDVVFEWFGVTSELVIVVYWWVVVLFYELFVDFFWIWKMGGCVVVLVKVDGNGDFVIFKEVGVIRLGVERVWLVGYCELDLV